jgi:hypothetical protein
MMNYVLGCLTGSLLTLASLATFFLLCETFNL